MDIFIGRIFIEVRATFHPTVADLTQIIELNPQDSTGYIRRADFYRDQGVFDLALADYNQAIEFNPQDSYSYLSWADFYRHQGEARFSLP